MRSRAAIPILGVAVCLGIAGFLRLRAVDPGTPDGGDTGVPGPAVGIPADGFYFRDLTEQSGVLLRTVCGSEKDKRFIIESNGSGAALLDYDLDGDLDVYIVNGSSIPILRGREEPVRNALYRNDGGLRFVDVTEGAGVGDVGWGYGCAVGDIDSDGDPDLYVTNFGPNVLYENLGNGTFREIGEQAGVADGGWGESALFGDIDNDGDLDLYVCNNIIFDIDNPPNGGKLCMVRGELRPCGPRGLPPQEDVLYSNDGSGHFQDISDSSGILDVAGGPRYGLGVVFGDYDHDGWIDIYVANDSVLNTLFQNQGDGTFKNVARLAGVEAKDAGTPQAGMGVDLGDFNQDGHLDIIVTNFSTDYNTLYRNTGDGAFLDVTFVHGLGNASWTMLGWGTKFFDADNDTDLDIYVANGHVYTELGEEDQGTYLQSDQLFLNPGDGTFQDTSERIVIDGPPRSSRGIAIGDLDNDGDLDVVVVEMAHRPTVLENVGGNKGNWVRLVMRGHRSNREGVGCRVWITLGEETFLRQVTRGGSYCSSHDVRLHVGLGEATKIDRLRVVWPSGAEMEFQDVSPVNRQLTIDEDAGLIP